MIPEVHGAAGRAVSSFEIGDTFMKFSLSNLLLVVAVVAVALGWWCDHARLLTANARLNAEAAALFEEAKA